MIKLWKNLTKKKPSDRVAQALAGRQSVVNDFFGGWEAEDIARLARYQHSSRELPRSYEIVDWLGLRTDARLHSWMGDKTDGVGIYDLPVPDDMVHAEAIEYIALISALERAKASGRKEFACFEIGSSYAPWAVAAGVLAKRSGFESVQLLALEANATTIPKIWDHAKRNDLDKDDTVVIKALHGAMYTHDVKLSFPAVDTTLDNGAQVSPTPVDKDYRGVEVVCAEVQGYSLNTLSADTEYIDFFHIDVQGTERLLLNDTDFLDVLTNKTSTLFLATQSRGIEGLALERLSARGWNLIRERPTVYKQNENTSDVEGWTLRDGGQLWVNCN